MFLILKKLTSLKVVEKYIFGEQQSTATHKGSKEFINYLIKLEFLNYKCQECLDQIKYIKKKITSLV
jgi:hypothetical protein